MAKKRSSRAATGRKAAAPGAAEESVRPQKRPRGQAAVGFLKSHGTRAFRKRRRAGG